MGDASIPDTERQATRIAVERDEFHFFALFEGTRSFLVAVFGADLEQVQFAAAAHVRIHLRVIIHEIFRREHIIYIDTHTQTHTKV
jgi:hypothetical protein